MVRIWWLMGGSAVFRGSGPFRGSSRIGTILYDEWEGYKERSHC